MCVDDALREIHNYPIVLRCEIIQWMTEHKQELNPPALKPTTGAKSCWKHIPRPTGRLGWPLYPLGKVIIYSIITMVKHMKHLQHHQSKLITLFPAEIPSQTKVTRSILAVFIH